MRALFRGILWIFSLLYVVACASMNMMYEGGKYEPLKPFGVAAESLPIIRYIEKNSPAKDILSVGDLIISVDGKPVKNTFNFYEIITPQSKTVKIQKKTGIIKEVSFDKIVEPHSYHLYVWLIEPGQTLVFKLYNPVYKRDQDSALLYLRKATALVSARMWKCDPKYLEVYIELRVDPDCEDCTLENIAVMDLSRKSWLTPVSPSYVAWSLYPYEGPPPNFMPVPPPTPTGYTVTTRMSGTLHTYSYGPYTTGSYSGTGFTQINPYYDYTATNFAAAYNLGVLIKHWQIQARTEARKKFVTKRLGNLRFGKLNPGERITGFVHFLVPEGFEGPYLVVVKSGDLGIARFDRVK